MGEIRDQAKSLLSAHRKELEAMIEALLSHETPGGQEILDVAGLPPALAPETRPCRLPVKKTTSRPFAGQIASAPFFDVIGRVESYARDKCLNRTK